MMTTPGYTYYVLKGMTSTSVAIAAGFIGYYTGNLVEGTSPIPLLVVMGTGAIVFVARAAEVKLDEKVAGQGLDSSDTRVTGLILAVLIVITIGASLVYGIDVL